MHTPDLRTLTQRMPHAGRVDAIYLRPARGAPCVAVPQTTALAGIGLSGDRLAQKKGPQHPAGKRQVTLIQAEHLAVVAALLQRETLDPAILRRNLVVSGINLLSAKSVFKDQAMVLQVGNVCLEVTGPCEPCSKMEALLGHGAYNALRGHGGVTARILTDGMLQVGDTVRLVPATPTTVQASLFP